MKSVLAGDNLPEVIVSSSYSKVHGINFAMWSYLNGFLPHVYDGGGGSGGGYYAGWEQLPYVDVNRGGVSSSNIIRGYDLGVSVYGAIN